MNRLTLVVVVMLAIASAREARAQQACVDAVNLPNPVFMTLGETQIPLTRALGKLLRDTEDITLVWRATGSCPNLQSLYNNEPITTNMFYIPAGYDGVSTPPTCSPGAGIVPDIADSVVFVDACPLTRPDDVGDFRAAAQPFAFVVPLASSQNAITAEEAYFLFGFGAVMAMVTPWVDPMLTYILPASKGTTLNLATMIGVPAAKFQGELVTTLEQLAMNVGSSGNADATIGILGSGTYEEFRGTMRPLAFQAFGQYRAYYPNSTLTALDKKPVRFGQYNAWSYTHWLARVDGSGVVINPTARRVIDLITGKEVDPPATFDALRLEIDAHMIPVCAMHVERASEGGELAMVDHPEPCDCYFDEKTGTPGPECETCSTSDTCDDGRVCRRGFCEAR